MKPVLAAPARRARRGNYVMLLAAAVTVALGLGAFAIDIPYRLMSQGQAQGVADAAAHAALVALRRGADESTATAAAQSVVAANGVAGVAPDVLDIQFGAWDDTQAVPVFSEGGSHPNAVSMQVGRTDGSAVDYLFAKIIGYTTFDVSCTAVAASRSAQVAFVLDVSPSWTQADFAAARAGLLDALDRLSASASPGDVVSLTVYNSRYAWTVSPWTSLADAMDVSTMRAQWAGLNVASRAGVDADAADTTECTYNTGGSQDDFTDPVVGGCYPTMPRAYVDEAGADPSVGLRNAEALYGSSSAVSRFRSVVLITGHNPAAVPSDAGTQRAADSYSEARWPEFAGDADHSLDAIRTDSVASAGRLWSSWSAHTWVVALNADDAMFASTAQGDGYAVQSSNASDASRILREIVAELPIAVVE
jgi:hypothetical protein